MLRLDEDASHGGSWPSRQYRGKEERLSELLAGGVGLTLGPGSNEKVFPGSVQSLFTLL